MDRLTLTLILLISLATGALPAFAQGGLDEGMTAYRNGDYAKAVELWRPLAEKGDVAAQYRLGSMYGEGKGVAQDDKEAFKWFQRAAEKGNAPAQYNVGASYAAGIGVAKDDAEAAKWFRRAADQGMPYAQLNLGLLYAGGHGVPQDNVEAMTWLQLALFSLPPGAARSDVARAMEDVSAKMTDQEREDARDHVRSWKPKPEGQ
jgi:TPR repeat protein